MTVSVGRVEDDRRAHRVEEPIRVLWLIKGLGRGGAELLLCNAAAVADRERFHYEAAYILPSRDALVEELRRLQVPVHLFAASSSYDLRWVLRFRKFLSQNRFDIVHMHSPMVASFARLAVRSMRKGSRPKLIATEHVPWSGYVLPTRFANAATFSIDDTHLAVSEAVRRSIPRLWRRRVRSLVHGVPLQRLKSQSFDRRQIRLELGIADDEILVGTVANFRAQKAYQDLIAAASQVIDRGRKVRFAFVGDGPTKPDMMSLARRLQPENQFLFLGTRDDATKFIAGCDIFALSSHYEGLPLVVMEALALGVPVVATGVDGVAELVREGVDGFLVPKARPDLLAQAIDTLILDGELRASFSDAATEGSIRFDNRVAYETIESIYEDLALTERS